MVEKENMECGSYRFGDCHQNPKDCVFEKSENINGKSISPCSGEMKLIEIDSSSSCQKLKCMVKCIDKIFNSKEICEDTCP